MAKNGQTPFSRRDFLKAAGTGLVHLAVGVRLAPAFAQAPGAVPATDGSSVVLHSYDPLASTGAQAVREALLAATDLRWLREGDSVFVKVACNSNRQSPAVTSPAAVEGVVALLKEAGAGKVYVGDMSGAMFVRHLPTGTVGSTRENMRLNGLLAAAEGAGAEIHCFEEVPFESAFVPGIPRIDHHWGEDLYVAEILDRVDHIVNLPRLGKHVLAGVTLGMKNAVGWISDHSRMALHRDGDVFHEKIVELNAIPQLADKMRVTLTLADQVLTTNGPDDGYRLPLAQPLVLASQDVVAHDQIALLTLLWARNQTPAASVASDQYPDESNGLNWWFVRAYWGEAAAQQYRTLNAFDSLPESDVPTHINLAWDRLRSQRPETITAFPSGLPLPESLAAVLTNDEALHVAIG